MQAHQSIDQAAYEWQPCSIILPRIGVMFTRHGARTRLILPGQYMVRRSRSLGQWIYRYRSSEG
ncbi:MAG: hypothetical protein HEQ22_11780 [Sphingopyxis sp.]|uniref:hypothetical protein n=1 Tax=Sphingopyxis sp. TaxID=1908224 RepID=UPI003D80C9C0